MRCFCDPEMAVVGLGLRSLPWPALNPRGYGSVLGASVKGA